MNAHGVQTAAWLLVVLPALSAAVLLLGGRRTDTWGHLLGVLVPVVLFVYAVILFFSVKSESAANGAREINHHMFTWIPVGSFKVDVGLLIDPLSMVFVLLITGVGSLIHIYAVGYMAHDHDRRRFFGYFNLFIAAMLLLVLANNYLVLYVGWEGVGLASYLLIGWYSDRPTRSHRGPQGVHRQPGRRRRPVDRDHADVRLLRHHLLRRRLRRSSAPAATPARASPPRSGSCCCSAPAASPASSRCRPGCPTRWRARPRCRR